MPAKKRSVVSAPESENADIKPVPVKRQRKTKGKAESSSEVSATAPSVVQSTTSTTTTTTAVTKQRRKKATEKMSSRTPSNYVLFSMEERKHIVAQYPDLTLGEVSKRCGDAWKALDANAREPWNKKANELKQKRLEEIANVRKSEPPKKKRAPSSYLLFAMEHRKVVLQNSPDLAIGDISKRCGEVWRGMNDAEKQVWKDQATKLKQEEA